VVQVTKQRTPKLKDKKDTQINIRLTTIEKRNLDIMSKHQWRSSSDFVRRLISREWKRVRQKEGPASVDAMIDSFESGEVNGKDVGNIF